MARRVLLALIAVGVVVCPFRAYGEAVCNDGSYSPAAGSGACSGHQGVSIWVVHKPVEGVTPVTRVVVTAPATPQRTGGQMIAAVVILALVIAIQAAVIFAMSRRRPRGELRSVRERTG